MVGDGASRKTRTQSEVISRSQPGLLLSMPESHSPKILCQTQLKKTQFFGRMKGTSMLVIEPGGCKEENI